MQAEKFYKEILEIPEKKEAYQESIKNLILFLEGKKKRLIADLEKQMRKLSKENEYEEAAKLRDKIFALRHIQDMALISAGDENFQFSIFNFQTNYKKNMPYRIEAYDISNIFGQCAAGGMAVFADGRIDTDQYRYFRIRRVKKISDTAMLAEVLERRFRHTEWKMPDLLIIDGGLGQLNAARKVLAKYRLDISIVAIAKGLTRKDEKLFMTKNAPDLDKKVILVMRDEAHRFAISYHRKLKRKSVIYR